MQVFDGGVFLPPVDAVLGVAGSAQADEVDLAAGVDSIVAVGAAFGKQLAGRVVAAGKEGEGLEFSLDVHQFNSSRVREKLSMKCSTK